MLLLRLWLLHLRDLLEFFNLIGVLVLVLVAARRLHEPARVLLRVHRRVCRQLDSLRLREVILVFGQLGLRLHRLSHVVLRRHSLVSADVRVRRVVTTAAEDRAARRLALRRLLTLLLLILLLLVVMLLLMRFLIEGLLTRDLKSGLYLMSVTLRRRRGLRLHLGNGLLADRVAVRIPLVSGALVIGYRSRVAPVFVTLVRAVRQPRILVVAL